MSNKLIAQTLAAHSIETCIERDHILALEHYSDAAGSFQTRWVNVTGWGQTRLLRWLGY